MSVMWREGGCAQCDVGRGGRGVSVMWRGGGCAQCDVGRGGSR